MCICLKTRNTLSGKTLIFCKVTGSPKLAYVGSFCGTLQSLFFWDAYWHGVAIPNAFGGHPFQCQKGFGDLLSVRSFGNSQVQELAPKKIWATTTVMWLQLEFQGRGSAWFSGVAFVFPNKGCLHLDERIAECVFAFKVTHSQIFLQISKYSY